MSRRPRRRRLLGQLSQFDSLVDIVSNNVGVLVILGTFVALTAVLHPFQTAPPGGAVAQRGAGAPAAAGAPVRTLRAPWPHATSKNPVFAALIGGRVTLLDLAPVHEELLKRPTPRRPQPFDVRGRNATIRFYPVTNEVYCYRLVPDEGAGETADRAGRPGSDWTRERAQFDPERYFYFFWVASDSFESFRLLREQLRGEGLEVGWKPLRPGAPLELCQGVDGGSSLVPQ